MEYLAAPVLHVAIPWAQRPAGCGRGCPDNAAHDCADWTSNHRPGNDAGGCSCGLLGCLARCGRYADDAYENEVPHGSSPLMVSAATELIYNVFGAARFHPPRGRALDAADRILHVEALFDPRGDW